MVISRLGFVSVGDFSTDRIPHWDSSRWLIATFCHRCPCCLHFIRPGTGWQNAGKNPVTTWDNMGGASFKKKRWKSTPALYAFKIEGINIPISVSFRKGICNLKSVCMFVFSWEAFGKPKTMKCREKQHI